MAISWFVITVVLLLRAIADDERQQGLDTLQSVVSGGASQPEKQTVG